MIVRISKGRYDAALHAEVTRRMNDASAVLLPAIRALPGCLSYHVATDEASCTMVNVSLWDSLDHASAMATLGEMNELARQFIALGVEFERPILNYETLWHFSPP